VRSIFRRYAELGSVRLLKEELEAQGRKSKSWTSAAGRVIGGKPFSRGALYLILRNRAYRGEIVHKGQSHPANTRQSSISRSGMRFRHSSPATAAGATLAPALASPARSPGCCLIATATG
jgi:Recombinase